MRLLAIDDLDLTTLGLPELPLVTSRSERMRYGVRRRDGSAGAVYFGGTPEPAAWNVVIALPDATVRDTVLAALASDLSTERRLLAQRLDSAGTLVRMRAAPVAISEANQFDLVVDFESDDSVWVSDTAATASKIFTSSDDNSLVLTVPGNSRTRPALVMTPNVQRATGNATVGWRFRRRYVVMNTSAAPWLRLPVRIALGSTTALVTGAKALASGDDVRVVIDGIERSRTLVAWNTAASALWCILDHVPIGASTTVEVWYGNSAAGTPPGLSYPDLPPFLLDTSSNTSWVYATSSVAANAGKGVWHLFGTTPGSAADVTVPGAWRPVTTLASLDNEDDRAQLSAYNYQDGGSYSLAGLIAWRAAPGSDVFPVQRNAYDGVGLYHPLGVVSLTVAFAFWNESSVAALMVLARDSAAEDWQALLALTTAYPAYTLVPNATYTPATPARHVACALWPANGNYIPDGTLGRASVVWGNNLTVAISATGLAITGGAEEEIYELATVYRVGGGANGAPPYRAVHVGNAAQLSGQGTPRASLRLDTEALVIDSETQRHDIWSLVASASPWTPLALGGLLTAWYAADRVTGLASGAAAAQWLDSSPNLRHAAQGTGANQPIYRTGQVNGLPAFDFDGSTDFFTTPVSASTFGEWIFTVVRPDTAAALGIVFGASATGGRVFALNTSRQIAYSVQGGAVIDASAGLVTLGSPVLVAGQLLATSGRQIINGVEETFTHAQALTAALTSTIGATATGTSAFDGLIAEIVIARDLTTDKWRRIEGYLAQKYGLATGLPANHPYRSARPSLPIPGSKVEAVPTHAVTALAGWDDAGVTTESPANDWLPLQPLRDVLSGGDFSVGIAAWTPSVNESVTYAAQVGTAGTGTSQFGDVRGLAVDSAGQVWAGDTLNERLQLHTSALAFVRTAGGVAGSGNGQFAADNGPFAVAVDGSDNPLATDRGNRRVQRFTGTTGAYLSQIAGDALARSRLAEIPGLLAAPQQMARDSQGRLYVANYATGEIRRFSPTGVAQGAVIGGMTQNVGIAVDPSDNCYSCAYSSADGLFRIYSFSPSYAFRWVSQTLVAAARPYAFAADATNLFASMESDTIGFWSAASGGAPVNFFGGTGSGNRQFTDPRGVALGGGFLYVADYGNNRIQKFDATTTAFITAWGTTGTANGQFQGPYSVWVDSTQSVWVGEYPSGRVQRFSATGTWLETLAQPSATGLLAAAQGASYPLWAVNYETNTLSRWDRPLRQPQGIAVNRASGRIYVTDTVVHGIEMFDAAGAFLGFIGGPTGADSAPGAFDTPVAIDLNQTNGDLYVVEQGNARVQQLTADGAPLRSWGSPGSGSGQFQTPAAIAVNPASGDVSVLDAGRGDIQRFTPSGTYIVAIGSPGSGNGQFTSGSGLAINRAGTIYYASDLALERIQRFNATPIGAVAWDGGIGGAAPGSISLALTVAPGVTGVAVRAIEQSWHALNERDAVQVAAWVRTNSTTVAPLLQVDFGDADGVVLATVTEPVWTPLSLREYRRNIAAQAPQRVTQYRVAVALSALSTGATGTVWFDDLTVNANELVVIDRAMGEVGIEAAVRGRWIG